ncbi:TetR/AcrR family transcriptional regulator [Streptomyces capparidis]
MATEYSGGGDPRRSMELLWRTGEPPRRGPKPKLTVDGIVRAALAVADAEGLAALTMRRVAEELGVTAMSLYTYVPGKAELLDVMLDTLYGGMPRTRPREDHWRARLEAVADDNRALYARHPWLASVASVTRPPLGPGTLEKYEYELRAFDGLGLDDVERDDALAFLLGFVASCARADADAKASRQATGVSDEEWWEANAPLLERVFDPERYPTAARVGAAAGQAHQAAYDPDHAYTFGLRRVLDGLGVLVEAREGRRDGAGE